MRNNGKGRMNGMGSMKGMNFGFGMAETREEALQMMNMMMNMAGQINPADSDEDYDPFNVIEDEDDWDDDCEDEDEESPQPMTYVSIETGEVIPYEALVLNYVNAVSRSPALYSGLCLEDYIRNGGWRVKK
jgi:hypothetical protein